MSVRSVRPSVRPRAVADDTHTTRKDIGPANGGGDGLNQRSDFLELDCRAMAGVRTIGPGLPCPSFLAMMLSWPENNYVPHSMQ